MAFHSYIVCVANLLTDRYGLHPDDAVELIELYERPVLEWQAAGVPTSRVASVLYHRFQQIVGTERNPISSVARTALAVGAVLTSALGVVLYFDTCARRGDAPASAAPASSPPAPL